MSKTNPTNANNADEMLHINNGRIVLKDAVLREQYTIAIDYWKIVDGVNCTPVEVDTQIRAPAEVKPQLNLRKKKHSYKTVHENTTKAISGHTFLELKESAAKRFNLDIESFNLAIKTDDAEYEVTDQEEFDDTLELTAEDGKLSMIIKLL